MSRGKEQTVVIRVYKSDRDIYNKWCEKKVCDMPDLHRMMIEYGIRKQQHVQQLKAEIAAIADELGFDIKSGCPCTPNAYLYRDKLRQLSAG